MRNCLQSKIEKCENFENIMKNEAFASSASFSTFFNTHVSKICQNAFISGNGWRQQYAIKSTVLLD